MKSFIRIENGPAKGKSFALPEDRNIGIGRDPRCAIRLPDPMVSRIHCIIRGESGTWRVRDQRSSNCTLVNDAPVSEQTLTPGDVIQVGETLLTFSLEQADPLVGATVAGYRIDDRLGRGAMGTVYLAQQLSIDRPVAFKILEPRLARDEAFVSGFLQEARAAGRLNHPNVVQVYDAGQGQEHIYISMEYLEGGSVEDLLVREGLLPPSEAVSLTLDAAEALAFAERQQIVHRDIKPANLLRDGDGGVKIGDLGIATDLARPGAGLQARVVGSPRYMAPEQARGTAVDHRADIYALGATLYRMLAGVSPHEGQSVKEILKAKVERDPVPLKQRIPETPASLSVVVQKMLARDPDRRFSCALEVQEALSRALVRRAPRPRRKQAVAVRRRARSGSNAVVVGAIVAVVLIVGGLLFLRAVLDSPSRRTTPGATGAAKERGGSVVPAPPSDPYAEMKREREKAGRKEIDEISLAWRERRLSLEEAQSRLDAILMRYGKESLGPLVKARKEEMREEAARWEKETALAVASLRDRLGTLLAEGRLKEAAAALSAFDRAHVDSRQHLEEERAALAKAVAEEISAAVADVDRLLQEAEHAQALARVDALDARLPPDDRQIVASLRKKIRTAEDEVHEAETALAAAVLPVRSAVAALDFEGALRLLAEAVAGRSGQESTADRLREEITLARDVWARLLEALEPGNSVSLHFVPAPLETGESTARSFRVEEVRGSVLQLKSALRRPPTSRSVLSIETEDLVRLAQEAAGERELSPQEIQEGLGLLLLLRRGPERARELLLHQDLEPARRQLGEKRLTGAANIWLRVRLQEAEGLLKECSSSNDDGSAYDHVARNAAELILAWKDQQDYADVRSTLRGLYLQARQSALALLDPDRFFHAKRVESEGEGLLRLSYDFSTEDQLEDFVPAGESVNNPLRWVQARRLLAVKGEVRFLTGMPFRRRLAVRGTAVFLDKEAPNVNIVLWTDEKDTVSIGLNSGSLRLDRWRDPRGEPPADYFLVGMGYRLPFDVSELVGGGRWGGMLKNLSSFLPLYLRQSTLVILAGEKGSTLHLDRRELIWEMSAASEIRSSARFAVSMSAEGTLQWALNGRKVPFTESLRLDRMQQKAPHSGSVTFLTNNSEVHFGELEIEGEVDRAWLLSQAESLAKDELGKLDGESAVDPESGT
jgi:hypothetical protein